MGRHSAAEDQHNLSERIEKGHQGSLRKNQIVLQYFEGDQSDSSVREAVSQHGQNFKGDQDEEYTLGIPQLEEGDVAITEGESGELDQGIVIKVGWWVG